MNKYTETEHTGMEIWEYRCELQAGNKSLEIYVIIKYDLSISLLYFTACFLLVKLVQDVSEYLQSILHVRQ